MVAGLDMAKSSTKSAQDCSVGSICMPKCETTGMLGALLEDEVGKMCTRLYSESSNRT